MNPKRDLIGVISHRFLKLWLATIVVTLAVAAVQSPPLFLNQTPPTEILFQMGLKENETNMPVLIECKAEANPPPTYRWFKNGLEFHVPTNDSRISQEPGEGTLLITLPQNEDAGQYQCLASNGLGSAISHPVRVRKTEDSPVANQNIRWAEAEEGKPFHLTCGISEGSERPQVFWNLVHKSRGFISLNSSRFVVDPLGNLWFSNVTREDDASTDSVYTCAVFFPSRNAFELEKVALHVRPANASNYPPTALYVTNETTVAVKGDDVEIWCVIGGTPLPQIEWTRNNRTLAWDVDRVQYTNYGKTLRIKNVGSRDPGLYVCKASNGVGLPLVQSFNLEVEDPAHQCRKIIEGDKGSLEIKPSSTICLWVIKLENRTGFRLELDPLMMEPILIIPEQNPRNPNFQSARITGSMNATHEFEGKRLAIVVPPRREQTTLNWTGLDVMEDSAVTFTTQLVNNFEGSLEGVIAHNVKDKIFLAFEHESNVQFDWNLDTVLPSCNCENPCETISFTALEIRPDGNISMIKRTCESSSKGSWNSESSSHLVIILDVKSVNISIPSSKLRMIWKQQEKVIKRRAEGIIGAQEVGHYIVPFNSERIDIDNGEKVYGLAFDWNSRKIYWSDASVLMRSNWDGNDFEFLQLDPRRAIQEIVIEPISGNVYYSEYYSSGALMVCNNDANRCSTIMTGGDFKSIAIHSSKGFLFVYNWNEKTYRSHLDGSNLTVILGKEWKGVSLAVDEHEDRLYWACNRGIFHSDLNGKDIRMLHNVRGRGTIKDLDIVEDLVVYAKDENVFVTAKFGKGPGRKVLRDSFISVLYHRHVAFFGTRVSNRPSNPCEHSNCAHLCVLITRWSYRCM